MASTILTSAVFVIGWIRKIWAKKEDGSFWEVPSGKRGGERKLVAKSPGHKGSGRRKLAEYLSEGCAMIGSLVC
jgi:hypothetical protein